MASSEPKPLRALLPGVLGLLGRESVGAPALATLWSRLQGSVIAGQSWPVALAEGVLRVNVRSVTWRATLEAQEAVLRDRWNAEVRTAPLHRIEFRSVTVP